jgi:hypothetical protein
MQSGEVKQAKVCVKPAPYWLFVPSMEAIFFSETLISVLFYQVEYLSIKLCERVSWKQSRFYAPEIDREHSKRKFKHEVSRTGMWN